MPVDFYLTRHRQMRQATLTLDQKHMAFLGFQKGAKKVLPHVKLAEIKRGGNELVFTVTGNTDVGITHIHIPRILARDRWIDAIFRPYDAGQEAGDAAVSWWTRNGAAGTPDPNTAPYPIDPDFVKWMADATI